MTPALRRRLEVLAPRLHALGARPMAELLIEIAAVTDEPELVLRSAERFACLTPAIVGAVGADRFPQQLVVVPERAA